MKIDIFGTRSGTEPVAGRMQTALAIEVGDRIYWFDAGECCSETAHTMGVDVRNLTNVYISHPHMDHVGGLPKLLWLICKLEKVTGVAPRHGRVKVYYPNSGMWQGVCAILQANNTKYLTDYGPDATRITEGILTDDGFARVTTCANGHMPPAEDGPQSFSFLFEAEGKRVVFSGDVKSFDDLTPLLAQPCDLLLMETGHHDALEVCERAKASGKVGRILFLHHHRNTVADFENASAKLKAACGSYAEYLNDRDAITL